MLTQIVLDTPYLDLDLAYTCTLKTCIMLIFRASGHPRPTITWRREDGEPHQLLLSPSTIILKGGVSLSLSRIFIEKRNQLSKEPTFTFTKYDEAKERSFTFTFKDIHTEKEATFTFTTCV